MDQPKLTNRKLKFFSFFFTDKQTTIMTKNMGGKAFRKGKSSGHQSFRREIIFKEYGQEYALITKMLGNGHCECKCYDDVVRMGNIRGKMRRRVWISVGDIVLCGLRDYQDEKVDIIHKYSADEVHNLRTMGEIPLEEKDDDKKQNHDDDMTTAFEEEVLDFETI